MSNRYWIDKTDSIDTVLAEDFNSAFDTIEAEMDSKVAQDGDKVLTDNNFTNEYKTKVDNAVQKDGTKVLSTNDFTDLLKGKLEDLPVYYHTVVYVDEESLSYDSYTENGVHYIKIKYGFIEDEVETLFVSHTFYGDWIMGLTQIKFSCFPEYQTNSSAISQRSYYNNVWSAWQTFSLQDEYGYVAKALEAVSDGSGNNITNTYETKADANAKNGLRLINTVTLAEDATEILINKTSSNADFALTDIEIRIFSASGITSNGSALAVRLNSSVASAVHKCSFNKTVGTTVTNYIAADVYLRLGLGDTDATNVSAIIKASCDSGRMRGESNFLWTKSTDSAVVSQRCIFNGFAAAYTSFNQFRFQSQTFTTGTKIEIWGR